MYFIKLYCHAIITGLPRSLPNADQCRSMPIKIMALIRNVSQCRSLPIIADQCRSMPINADQCRSMPIKIMALIRNVSQSTLGSMPEFWAALIGLIGIGHWPGESCHKKAEKGICHLLLLAIHSQHYWECRIRAGHFPELKLESEHSWNRAWLTTLTASP